MGMSENRALYPRIQWFVILLSPIRRPFTVDPFGVCHMVPVYTPFSDLPSSLCRVVSVLCLEVDVGACCCRSCRDSTTLSAQKSHVETTHCCAGDRGANGQCIHEWFHWFLMICVLKYGKIPGCRNDIVCCHVGLAVTCSSFLPQCNRRITPPNGVIRVPTNDMERHASQPPKQSSWAG